MTDESSVPSFRERALEHHRKRQNEIEFPQLVRPGVFRWLWPLLGLLLLAVVLLTQLPVSVQAPGLAVWQPQEKAPEAWLVVPQDHADAVRAGDQTVVQTPNGRDLAVEILSIESQPQVRDVLSQRLEADLSKLPATLGPLMVARASLPADFDFERNATKDSKALPVRVRIGERRIRSLLPGIGRGGDSAAK